MNKTRWIGSLLLAAGFGLAVAACGGEEGPAERMGQRIDEAAEEIEEEAEELGEEMEDAFQE